VPKNIYLSAALIWTCSILFLCLASFSNLPDVGLENADKYVHFTFHFVFVNLWFLYFNYKNQINSIKLAILIFISHWLSSQSPNWCNIETINRYFRFISKVL
jgi:hypothetical protein